MRPLLEVLLLVVALATHTCGHPYGTLDANLRTQDQRVWHGDGVSQVRSDDFPGYKENAVPRQIGSGQIGLDQQVQSQQGTFEKYKNTHASSEPQRNLCYVYESAQTIQSHLGDLDALTVSCSGANRICVAKSLCVDGYVHPLKQGFVRAGQAQECRLSHEVCCTVRYDLNNLSYDNQLPKDNQFREYPEPSLENDQRYVPFGENNQADVAELSIPLRNDAELQSASNDGFVLQSTDRPHGGAKLPEEGPDYNQVPESTNLQNQFQKGFDNSGGADTSESISLTANPTAASSAIFRFSVHSGCAAALLCVEEQYCTLEGVISTEPVALTSQQLLRRVPLSSCRISETGVVGKCCRDPNYVDPWPTGNLPANYTGGFDEQGFPTFLNIAKVRPTKKPQPIRTTPKPLVSIPIVPPHDNEHQQPTSVVPLVPDNSDETPQRVVPLPTQIPIAPSSPAPFTTSPYDFATSDQVTISIVPQPPRLQCGVRNHEQRPSGFRKTDATFGEIPWQAMILWSPERKILCSGALVAADVVLTAASCVHRFLPNELSVKLGEWKLGYELQHEEPLPFEIVNVRAIKYHPGFVEGLSSNDTAMLLLEHPVTFNLHVNTLCLPDDYQVQETSQCIVTGWGKSILQAHYAGAIMHMVDVDLLSHDVCQNRLLGAESQINIANDVICGKAREENNMCQADVGGPLACYDGKGAYHIAGIYSQDTGCLPTNQVATFAPIDLAWLKQTMHTTETKIDTVQTSIDDGYDYRKSNLPAGNEYLPPVGNDYLPPWEKYLPPADNEYLPPV